MATEGSVVVTDPVQGGLDDFGHGGSSPLAGRGGLAVASTEADRRRELLGDGLHLLAGALGPPGVVEAFGLVQLVAQLGEPLAVGDLGRRVQDGQSLLSAHRALVSRLYSRGPRTPFAFRLPIAFNGGDQILDMEIASGMAQEIRDVVEALRVLHAAHRALVGEGPEVALVAKERGGWRSGFSGRGPGLGARHRIIRNGFDATPIWRALLALRPQRVGALDPARHADGLELLACHIEERPRPVAIAVRPAPDLHPGLVEVDERTQRARALLVEDGAGALEPLVGFAGAFRKRAELRHRQARIDAKIAEVAGERLGEQVLLQHVGEVGAAKAPERHAAGADQSGVGVDATTRALDGGHRAGHGAQGILVPSGEGEPNRRHGVRRGAPGKRRESESAIRRVDDGPGQLEPRTATIEDFARRQSTEADNQRRVARAVRELGETHEIPLGQGQVPECRAQAGALGYEAEGYGELTP